MYDVFIIAGQSNTHGGVNNVAEVIYDNPNIMQLARNKYGETDLDIIFANEPLHNHDASTFKIGFAMPFAENYERDYLESGRKILLIPCGANGTGFSNDYWNPGDNLYNDMISRVNYIKSNYPDSEFKGILWHQGEQDVSNSSYNTDIDNFITSARTDIGVSDLPFIMGGMVPYWVDKVSSRGTHEQRMKDVALRHSNIGFADPRVPTVLYKGTGVSDTAANDNDMVHYDATQQLAMGERYYSEYQEIVPLNQGTPTIYLTDDDIKAFPTAMGFGKNATGARAGGTVIFVDNLLSTGGGSLRDALSSSSGNVHVIPRVSGFVELNEEAQIQMRGNNVTIHGHLAPGGFGVHGSTFNTNDNSNIIIRGMRFMPGDQARGHGRDALIIRNGASGNVVEDIIIDRCSIKWGDDENLALESRSDETNVIRNVTIQRSIIGEAFEKDKGMILWRRNENISVLQNLFAHNRERNIRASTKTSDFEMINNIIYGCHYATQLTYENTFDIIGNVYISNPNEDFRSPVLMLTSTSNSPDAVLANSRAYVHDNIEDGGPISKNSDVISVEEGSPIFNSGAPVLSSSTIVDYLEDYVGPRLPSGQLDSQDQKLWDDMINRTGGFNETELTAGGLPNISGSPRYVDSNNNGLSDEFESMNPSISGPNDVADVYHFPEYDVDQSTQTTNATSSNRYTAIEIFSAYMAGDFNEFEVQGGIQQPSDLQKRIAAGNVLFIQ